MSSTTTTVTLTINGTSYSCDNPEPYYTLNDFSCVASSLFRCLAAHLLSFCAVRSLPNLKGTRVNCNQGGCGVCTVVISYKDGSGGAPKVPPALWGACCSRLLIFFCFLSKVVSANSCLRPLISCHGAAVTTVEGLGSTAGGLNPIQERLAANNGSQCGFCTSGMVATMAGTLAANPQATQAEIVEALDGNLCRCTGYRPIVAAFTSLASDFVDPRDAGGCCGGGGAAPGCCKAQRAVFNDVKEVGINKSAVYDHSKWAVPAVLPKVAPLGRVTGRENSWVTVNTLADLYAAVASAPPHYSLVVGHTSSGVYPMPVPKLFINITGVPDLYGIVNTSGSIVIGASETLQVSLGRPAYVALLMPLPFPLFSR